MFILRERVCFYSFYALIWPIFLKKKITFSNLNDDLLKIILHFSTTLYFTCKNSNFFQKLSSHASRLKFLSHINSQCHQNAKIILNCFGSFLETD